MTKNKTQKLFDRLPSEVVYSKEESEMIFKKMNTEIEIEERKNLYESFKAEKKVGEIFLNF